MFYGKRIKALENFAHQLEEYTFELTKKVDALKRSIDNLDNKEAETANLVFDFKHQIEGFRKENEHITDVFANMTKWAINTTADVLGLKTTVAKLQPKAKKENKIAKSARVR